MEHVPLSFRVVLNRAFGNFEYISALVCTGESSSKLYRRCHVTTILTHSNRVGKGGTLLLAIGRGRILLSGTLQEKTLDEVAYHGVETKRDYRYNIVSM